MNIKISDKSLLIKKGMNPVMVEHKLRQDIEKRIEHLAQNIDLHLVKNVLIIPNNKGKAIAEVKPYFFENQPCLDIYLQNTVVSCWLNGIRATEFEEVIFHELCHCDDIAKTVACSETKYFIDLDSLIQNVVQLYEHMGIFMWGEYIAYFSTYKRYIGNNNSLESQFSNAIHNARISLEFIKNNRNETASIVYDVTRKPLRDLFYSVTKNISLISVLDNDMLNEKNDELLTVGESHVAGLKALSYKVRKILLYMKSIAYTNDFTDYFYKLGEIFYSIYLDNGIKPIDNNGELEFVYY